MESRDVNYSVFDGLTIHLVDTFRPDEIDRRSTSLGQLTSPPRIETFAWLLEVAAQLSKELGPRFILRGGTNVQLRLDTPFQRGSQDIDGLYRGTIQELDAGIKNISARFRNCDGFLQFKRQPRDFPPKDFAVWTCPVPAMKGGQIYDGMPRRLLAVEVSMIDRDLPTEGLEGAVFGMQIGVKTEALTRGALIGDKILTLGSKTTGIIDADDRVARQLYDLDNLLGSSALASNELAEAVEVASYLAPIEAGYRGLDIGPLEALEDAADSAIDWGHLGGLDGGTTRTSQEIQAWQGSNVPRDQHVGVAAGWTVRALKVALLAKAIAIAIERDPDVAANWLSGRFAFAAEADGVHRACRDLLIEKRGRIYGGLKSPEHATLMALATLSDQDLEGVAQSAGIQF